MALSKKEEKFLKDLKIKLIKKTVKDPYWGTGMGGRGGTLQKIMDDKY